MFRILNYKPNDNQPSSEELKKNTQVSNQNDRLNSSGEDMKMWMDGWFSGHYQGYHRNCKNE